LRDYIRENFAGEWKILYAPTGGSVLDHWRAVGVVAYAAGNLLLCIDELGLLCENGQFKHEVKNDDPILEKIVHFGRHRGIRIMSTSQLPTDIALRYRSLCSEFRMFKITEPEHMKYLAARIGKANAAKLPHLEKYWFMVWKDDGSTVIVRPQPV